MLHQLSTIQKDAIASGKRQKAKLVRACKQAVNSLDIDLRQKHFYIYGPAGIGKTYNTVEAVKQSGVIFREVSGNVSMYYLGIELAVTKYLFPEEKVIVIIDDCDEIFKDSKSINMFKGILGGENGLGAKFSYLKRVNMSSLGQEGDDAYDAVESFRKGVGFEVPLDNFTFIITSNQKLPYDDTVEALKKEVVVNGEVQLLDTASSKRAGHLSPIRSRCQTKDFTLSKEEKWGLIASTTLEESVCRNCNEEQTLFILNYMWNNWNNLTETSIRTVEKMSDTLALEGEHGIVDIFDMDFLKS
jgi:hypothetical protein